MSEPAPGGPGPSAAALVRQALAYRAAGADAKAIDLLKQALAVQPDHLDAQIQLGVCYLDAGKSALALEVLQGAARQAPNSDIVHRLCALGHLQKRQLTLAKREADEAVRLDPNDGIGHTVLGRVLARQQTWAAAEASLRKGVELAPTSSYALVHLGYYLLNRKKLKAAAAVAEDAGRAAPDDFGVMLLRGDVALRSGRADEARDFALWALSHRATNREAIRLLVSVKARQNWFLGLWWRVNSNVWLRLLLVIATIPLGVWFLTPIYLVAGRMIFDHMLKQELKTVTLRRDF